MYNIMLDLETLSTEQNAIVVSIGAVKFNGDGIIDTFYEIVDTESCLKYGMELNMETVNWWMKQNDEARSIFNDNIKTGIETALLALLKFVEYSSDHKECFPLWGNGSDFDNVIINNALKKCLSIELPFFKNRCYRTMKKMFPHIKPDDRNGTHHNAVNDAIHQTNHLIKICNAVGIEL